MPDNFAEASNGVVLIANGIDPMVRWDAFSEQAVPAGVTPPATAVVLTGTGTGAITGAFRGFVRFVDRNGNVSDLSPIGAEVTLTSKSTVVYGSVPVSLQATVVRRQLLRNTAGQQSVFYVDVDTTDLTSTSINGVYADAELANQEAVPLLDSEGLPFANRHGVPPSEYTCLAFHNERMFAWGIRSYSEGSITVTKNSATVTGVGTRWPESFRTRFLYVDGASKSYEIQSCNAVTQTLTLTENYIDDTNAFAAYTIKPPPALANNLPFSEPGLPESWPATNGLGVQKDNDDGTALMPFDSFLYIMKRRSTYRLTCQADPANDGAIFFNHGRGCINNRCWVVVDSTAYLMDELGIYSYVGGAETTAISTPIQDFYRPEDGAINWSAANFFHASWSPTEEVIRWHVTLRGCYLPRHSITLAYKTGKWSIEETPLPIGGACIGRSGRATGGWTSGASILFFGSFAGQIYTADFVNNLDGVGATSATIFGLVTSAGLDTLTDSRAAFDTTWENLPVAITEGRGAGQQRIIVKATATKLTLNEPWSVTPDTTSKYLIGAIRYKYRSARQRLAPTEKQNGRSFEMMFRPSDKPLVMNYSHTFDFFSLPARMGRNLGIANIRGMIAKAGDYSQKLRLDETTGNHQIRFDGHREGGTSAPQYYSFTLEGFAGVDRVSIGEVLLNGMVR